MMIIPDSQNVYLPQADDLLVSLTDSYDLIMTLLEGFQNYFANSQAPKTEETCFVGAIQAANNIAKHIGAKLLMF